MSGLSFTDYTFSVHKRGGHVANYQPARWTTALASNKMYNAFLSEDGSYVIMERNFTDLTIKYFIRQTSLDLDTDWAGRTGLTYVEYSALFPS